MSYKVFFCPSTRIQGAREGSAEYPTATSALKGVEGLVMSDERVRILGPHGGEIDVGHLRVLAGQEGSEGTQIEQ